VQVNCSKCGQPIALTDAIESSNGRLSHLDCARRRGLSADERKLVFVYCSDHVVAQCLSCGVSFRYTELAADPLGGRTNLCPRCRKELTENVRAHLYGCPVLPVEIRLKAHELRETARKLVKQSQQLTDKADVLIRQTEAEFFAAQQALRALMRNRAAR
jgi:hypothetical protein